MKKEQACGRLGFGAGAKGAAVAYRKPPYRTLPRVRPCERVSSWLLWVVASSQLCLLQHTPVPAAPCTQCHRGIPSLTHSLFCATLTARSSERTLVGSVMINCILCALLTSGSPLVGACVGCTCCELAVFNSAHPCLGDASAARLLRYGYTAVNSLFLFLTLSLHRPLSRAISLNLSPSLSPFLFFCLSLFVG